MDTTATCVLVVPGEGRPMRDSVAWTLAWGMGLASVATAGTAFADEVNVEAHEVPILVVEQPEAGAVTEESDALDLANLVASAAKSSTTVQEAPAIITIVTEDELADRHPLFLTDVIDSIPGFTRLDAFFGTFPQILARGLL